MEIVEQNDSTEEDDVDACQCTEDDRCEACMLKMIEWMEQVMAELALELLNG